MPNTRSVSRLVIAIFLVVAQLPSAGCNSISEKPKTPPVPQELHTMILEETEAAIHKLEKQLEEEKGERVTGELMSLVHLIFLLE